MKTTGASVWKLGLPNPGSLEAVSNGCRCPMFDNNLGEGFSKEGKVMWAISDECEIHKEEKP